MDGLPSIAEGQMPRARHWQLNPNFRTDASGGPHGRIVPLAEVIDQSTASIGALRE
jgi:hypothetical protein